MPVFLRRQELEEAFVRLAEGDRHTFKLPLDVRWHDGEVAHVRILPPTGDDPNPQRDLIVLSSRPLEIGTSETPSSASAPLHLLAWREPGCELSVRVVQAPVVGEAGRPVQFIPSHDQIFARHRGLIETDRLRDRRVAVFGVGSIGSCCAVELVKAGVGCFSLVDHDHLELHNIARHACGISALGRRKTHAVRDLLLDTNPACRIETCPLDVLEHQAEVERLVADADVVLVATDNNASRLLLNASCLQHGKVVIFGRAMTRACGLDVIRVRPGEGPCYQCLLQTVLSARPEEVSGPRQADALAYADRPVRAEPGLANDLMPAVQLMTKLVIQHLLQDSDSELRSLDRDLTADLYFWANRRTDKHPGLVPMEVQAARMTILRWYGVDLSSVPPCSMCSSG